MDDIGANGHDDEVVATVVDDDEARPIVEALLLAGLGPALRPGRDGIEVTVVTGQGDRAREVLGAPEPETSPFAEPEPTSAETAPRGPEWSSLPAGTAARAARRQGEAADDEVEVGSRFGMAKVLILFAVACVVIPLIAFYISYRAAGG